jgi:chromosome segregation ATPase
MKILYLNSILHCDFRQQEAEDELNVVLKELRAKQKLLADAEEHLQKLEDIYDQSVAEKNKLELNIDRTQARLKRSDLLVVALSDEQHRWEKNIKVLYFINCQVVFFKLTIFLFYLDVFSMFINCCR